MTRETVASHGTAPEAKLVQVGNYKFTGKLLGKGSFAVVKEAVHTQLHVHVSVKIIDLKKCNSYMMKHYIREATILQTLNHPFIMRLFETMKYNNMYYTVTELVQGGDLCTYVQHKKGKVDEIVTRRFSRQIASALSYLHGRGIVHRDLKLENVMLDSTKRNIKLIDFGLTNSWATDSPLKTLCGSPEYSAPELFVPGTMYGPEVDMWALGVVMFAMAAGRLPFPCLSVIMKIPEKKSQFLKTVNDGLSEAQTVLIKGYSPEFTELVRRLMNPNWEERLKIDDVFADPWMTNRDHWTDVPHETLDSYDLERIVRQLSFKLKTTPEKLKAELKARPSGEVGGLFNIMTHEEVRERYKQKSGVKSVSSQNETRGSSFFRSTASKKRSSKQISEGPIKISLLGNAMKLNEVTFARSPARQNSSTPTSTTISDPGFKPDNYMGKQTKIALPKVKTFKSNCSSPITSLKNHLRTENKSIQVNTTFRRRLTVGKIILPSKIETNHSANSMWEQEQSWRKI